MAKKDTISNELAVATLEEFNDIGKAVDLVKVISVPGLGGKNIQIRSLTNDEHEAISESAVVHSQRGGVSRINHAKIKLGTMVNGIVAPNFNSADFLDSKDCAIAEDYFTEYFTPGAIDFIYAEISKLSGFNIGMEDLIDTAKN
jgi:hypothetical protein